MSLAQERLRLHQLQQQRDRAAQSAKSLLERATGAVQDTRTAVSDYTRAHPEAALGIAAGAGFAAALLLLGKGKGKMLATAAQSALLAPLVSAIRCQVEDRVAAHFAAPANAPTPPDVEFPP